ncbi:unnamed protein product [Periconia digitata]|uniref:Uncharacterized protein n=1 Tax=Periconia digitata TaxID=1303443 RepID=A0A9W4U2M7_9PLEO|nr:unnamed protein product [Periconia digitata]
MAVRAPMCEATLPAPAAAAVPIYQSRPSLTETLAAPHTVLSIQTSIVYFHPQPQPASQSALAVTHGQLEPVPCRSLCCQLPSLALPSSVACPGWHWSPGGTWRATMTGVQVLPLAPEQQSIPFPHPPLDLGGNVPGA